MMALILVFVWFSQNYYYVCLVTLHAFVEFLSATICISFPAESEFQG
jgi:hypothetical protein